MGGNSHISSEKQGELQSTIIKCYTYELLGDLTDFVSTCQELSHKKMGRIFTISVLDDSMGIVLRSLFLERKKKSYDQKHLKDIVRDAFSKLSEPIADDQVEEYVWVLMKIKGIQTDISEILFSNKTTGMTQNRSYLKVLEERIDNLLTQVGFIIDHVKEIVEEDRIFDIEDSERVAKPDFYHG